MDLLELERRKSRLLSMVEEVGSCCVHAVRFFTFVHGNLATTFHRSINKHQVDRRYRVYREQMRAVEVWFEAVAGAGASQVYTRLALRAMSRHFRCLRDALVAQLRKQQQARMGEISKQQGDYGGEQGGDATAQGAGPVPAAAAGVPASGGQLPVAAAARPAGARRRRPPRLALRPLPPPVPK